MTWTAASTNVVPAAVDVVTVALAGCNGTARDADDGHDVAVAAVDAVLAPTVSTWASTRAEAAAVTTAKFLSLQTLAA